MSDLIKNEVLAFKNARGKPPRQIIVYVSGVPEAERGYVRDGNIYEMELRLTIRRDIMILSLSS